MSSFGVELLEVFQRSFSQEADLHFIKFSNKQPRRKPEREGEKKALFVWKKTLHFVWKAGSCSHTSLDSRLPPTIV